jgi:hypothetical protein
MISDIIIETSFVVFRSFYLSYDADEGLANSDTGEYTISPTINSIKSFYLRINQRYLCIFIHLSHITNQYFAGIVFLTHRFGGIVNGNET